MEKFLSIDEVIRLKNIERSLLQYYERIGIFKPAYINPTTLVRYYALSQLFLLDMIIAGIDLDIPIKTFIKYIQDDGTLDILTIKSVIKTKTKEKVHKLNKNLFNIEKIAEHLNETEQISLFEGQYKREIKERYLYLEPFEYEYFNLSNYLNSIKEIKDTLLKQNISVGVNQGFCFINKNSIMQPHVYFQIYDKDYKTNTMIVPQKNFLCYILKSKYIPDYYHTYLNSKENMIICRMLFDKSINLTSTNIEVQFC
ncbi:hypothetical protein AN639_04510 [Candidatus Epulonipiscium fishelsonii]|uniref:Uncharacterized protein n=1 Tax=Candidatus Epulonipiscium fishelsonii TaxID=77094 RepID=A0ACC8X891_9FIRM|nr:hypothetical protein AN396_11200 [Epulopiscium sp. SCG-B11WGA-EpuloA1]ONI40556.1 hypothetical protein AN639_04510 [Epulopiscium sp. SCG-B05WGA-EpuloA1]